MPAYAIAPRQSSTASPLAATDSGDHFPSGSRHTASGGAVLDDFITALADRIADAIAIRIAQTADEVIPEWLDSRGAAAYLGLHPDTIRKLAAERAIPAEQEGPGCKLFFLRQDLDEWRRAGGRSAHISLAIAA